MPKKIKSTKSKKNVVIVDGGQDNSKKKKKSLKNVKIEEESDDFELSNLKKGDDENLDNLEVETEESDTLSDNENEIDDEDKEISSDKEYDDNEDQESKDEDYNEKCIYNFAEDEEDEVDVEFVFDDDEDEKQDKNIVPKDKRVTKPILLKYERVRLLGDRTQQLALGAKPMIKNIKGLSSKEIAELELKNNVIPLILERPLPNGKKERWYIRELEH